MSAAGTADFPDIPEGWPPAPPAGEPPMTDIPVSDGDEPKPPRTVSPRKAVPPVVNVPGFFLITDREDLRRILVRWSDVTAVIEPLNPKDGTKVVVRGLGHFMADEPYPRVLAIMAEAYHSAQQEGRGY